MENAVLFEQELAKATNLAKNMQEDKDSYKKSKGSEKRGAGLR